MVKIGTPIRESRRHRTTRLRAEKDQAIVRLERLTASLLFKLRLADQRAEALERRIATLESQR